MTSPLVDPTEFVADLSRVRVIEAHGAADAASVAARTHIPNAVVIGYADLSDHDVDPSHGGRHPLPDVREFAMRVASWGIDTSTPVVVVDASAIGNDGAARCCWMLRAIGLSDVRVSSVALAELLATGGETPCMAPKTNAATLTPPTWLLPTVSIDDVARLSNDPNYRLIDARAAGRYRGDHEPIDPVAGHIPGAINVPFQDDLASPTKMKNVEDLRTRYGTLLADTDVSKVVVYCGSGITASQTLLAMEAAGFHGAALYVGSWSEWCRSGRPRSGA